MKKIPIILTSILATTAMVAPPTYATHLDDDGATWYTVSELLDYRAELDQELQRLCGNDIWCQQDNYYQKMENDNRVLALDQLTSQQFLMTAVNPGAGYVKMYFFGEDMMLSRMGIYEALDINQVYIGWHEQDPERIYRLGIDLTEYTTGDIEGLHEIYAWRSDYDTENRIKIDQETTLLADGLPANGDGQLVYAIDSGPGKFNALGRFIYTDCLSEPDYAEGVECQLMISAEKGQAYLPPRETTLSIISTDSPDVIEQPDNSNQDTPTQTNGAEAGQSELPAIEQAQEDEKGIASEPLASLVTAPDDSTPINNSAKTPNTGANTNPCNQKTVEFPWWLVIMIALGDAAVMWFFWPNRKKTRKKT